MQYHFNAIFVPIFSIASSDWFCNWGYFPLQAPLIGRNRISLNIICICIHYTFIVKNSLMFFFRWLSVQLCWVHLQDYWGPGDQDHVQHLQTHIQAQNKTRLAQKRLGEFSRIKMFNLTLWSPDDWLFVR